MLMHIPAQAPRAHRSHTVHLYDADATLLRDVTSFVRTTLGTGACAVVVATPAHREGIDARLHAQGVDMGRVCREGRYLALDAASTLNLFMDGDTVNKGRFNGVIGDLLQRAARRSRNAQHPVGVFGEMVALLASQGRHAAAIDLEDAWNQIALVHPFSLQCGYPMTAFARPADGDALATICATHTHVVPAESYSVLDDESHRLRALTLRQRDALAVDRDEPGGPHRPAHRVILHDSRSLATASASTATSPGDAPRAHQPALVLGAPEIIHGLHAVIGMHGLPLTVHGEDGRITVTCRLPPCWNLVIEPGPVPLAVAYRDRLPERTPGESDRWAPLWALLASWGTGPAQLRPSVTTSRFFPEFLDHLL